MKPVAKRNLIVITVNTLVMTCFFLIKYVFLPRIPNINLTSGSDLFFLLTWVPIPLISIIGLVLEKHVRFWIIPDFVYCALTFAISGEDCPYGIGLGGFFTSTYYSRNIALIDRLITFIAILTMQYAVKLLIKLIKRLVVNQNLK